MKIRTLILLVFVALIILSAAAAMVFRRDTVRAENAIVIEAPADVVWTYLVTPGHRMDWMRWLDDAIDLTRRGIKPGTRTVLYFVRDGLTFEVDEEILVADVPRLLTVRRVGGTATAEVTYKLGPLSDGGTRLEVSVVQTATTLWGPYLAYFLEREQRDVLAGDLQSLKAAVALAVKKGLLDKPAADLLPGIDLSPPGY